MMASPISHHSCVKAHICHICHWWQGWFPDVTTGEVVYCCIIDRIVFWEYTSLNFASSMIPVGQSPLNALYKSFTCKCSIWKDFQNYPSDNLKQIMKFYKKTSQELRMLSPSLFIQGPQWLILLFSIVGNVISVSNVKSQFTNLLNCSWRVMSGLLITPSLWSDVLF